MLWRNTALYPKLFIIDARCVFPIIILMVRANKYTFLAAVVAIVFFSMLNARGITLLVFLRLIRTWMAGPVRTRANVRMWRRRARG